ncbi:MAG: InlB B-repeat-containing protein [Bacilli bacterium]|nr:InlB B-repeat-containing protein [Bacilli bacterium]
MKKKFLSLLGIACFSLIIGVSGCNNKSNPSDGGGDVEPIQKTWTVAFEVDGARYQTLKVKDGEHITQTVADPTKEGYVFSGWYEGTELVDLAEYVVTKNVTFVAHFDENTGPVLSVDDVKEAGKTYYLVFGWWEVNDPDDPTKVTSYLTKDTVRLFYGNMIKYLKLKTPAATDAEIANIQFRNYSSAKVAEMGAAINADGDVDIIIGVGANIKTGGGVDYYDRFQTPMGTKPETRYVVAPTVATDLGKETFNWLKDTDAGKAAFLRELTDAEIEASLTPEEINLAVTVHGDTNVTTTLTDKDTTVTMPEFTAPDGKRFAGFALTADGEVVLTSTILKYDDLKDLVADGANTLDLYVVYEDIPVVAEDLIVYIQLNSGLKEVEAKLLEARFNETVTDKNIKFETVSGNASAFTTAVNEAGNVDVAIGGGNPVNSHSAHEQGPAATAGAKHFADNSRRICIESTVHPDHLTLAKTFYDFVVAEAPEFELHVAFWPKGGDWVTETEENQLKDSIQAQVKNYMNVTSTETLLDKYNIVITFVDVAGTKVANLGADTLALRDGKGTDLLIGCGDNVTTTGGITVVEKKVIPTTIVDAGRQVALVREHFLARNVYEVVFAEVEAPTE